LFSHYIYLHFNFEKAAKQNLPLFQTTATFTSAFWPNTNSMQHPANPAVAGLAGNNDASMRES
jgi:hypothetical protein